MEVSIRIRADGGREWREVRPVVPGSPLTFGRHPECSVRLESDLVSRHHCVVEVIGGAGLRVQDVSTNGTFAGRQLLKRQTLDVPFGTPIVLGDYTILIAPAGQTGMHAAVTGAVAAAADPAASRVGASPQPPIARAETQKQAALVPTEPPPPALALAPAAVDGAARRVHSANAEIELRRHIHKLLLEHLDLATMDPGKLDDPSLRPKVIGAVRRIVQSLDARLPSGTSADALVGEVVDEALGLGPLERFMADPQISEIMVVDAETIYVEKGGRLTRTDARFTDDDRVRAVIERIVTPLGRRIDESSPLVDARLKDGSRVNAVIRPIALRGSCITIRKFSKTPLTLDKLISFDALTPKMGRFLERSVVAKKNVVISGGTGSGKTTLLNILSAAIPAHERIVTIEDAAELQLAQEHVVSLETRPPNMEGRGEYTIRDLVKNALRMRPDRIVIGECRGGEALDMLQAMNTGHDGSLTTLHANSPREAIARLETLVLMAGMELPVRAIRDQIAGSIDLVVQQTRLSDGSRKVTAITEVTGIDDDGQIRLVPIYEFVRTSTSGAGKVAGEFRATGYLPTYLDQFLVMGLVQRGGPYL